VILRLPRQRFRQLFETDSTFRECVVVALAAELRRATTNIGELHFLDLPGRLALRLAALARESSPEETANVAIPSGYSQADLAAMIGGTRQTVNRCLAVLAKAGLVQMQGRQIVVIDVAALEARAGW
jgi:CRP/FNR family cyclic AMP-dependent transcriptional regulator